MFLHLKLNFPVGSSFQNSPRELVLKKVFKILKILNLNVFVWGKFFQTFSISLQYLSTFLTFFSRPSTTTVALLTGSPCWSSTTPLTPPWTDSRTASMLSRLLFHSTSNWSTLGKSIWNWRFYDKTFRQSGWRLLSVLSIKYNNICLLYRHYGKFRNVKKLENNSISISWVFSNKRVLPWPPSSLRTGNWSPEKPQL